MKKQNKAIAIVGIGCRYPGGASSPEKFWNLLKERKDAIVEVPSDRWDYKKFYDGEEKKAGKTRVMQGGFLEENIKDFDPIFFGIPPVEAESMDPQIRLLLEVTYEALEDSGIKMESLRGSKTGVFVGGFTIDNYLCQASEENRHLVTSHTSLGSPITMLSNRISYNFDLKGPSLSIDTACSSSLVATHYACQSILNGESDMALVGGVNVMLSPQTFVFMSQGQFLSKHGRCKSFDSDAGGYVRGEGAGMVVLKTYEQALKDGDRIYALIDGTGVNQDGQTSGITVPNGDSQMKLMRQVYKESGVDVSNIEYVEAHGTGTPVGDPIEFGAINKVMSENRSAENKLFVGSVKSNIGHLEAGAGVAGLIKTALCLYNNKVPANLHFNNPNPALDYENSILRVPTTMQELSDSNNTYAAINSFGYGGTNAHALLKQYNAPEEKASGELERKDNFIFPLSAKSDTSLKEMVVNYREFIDQHKEQFPEILSNLMHRRSFHSNRLGVFANSVDDLIEKLEAYEEDIMVNGIVKNNAVETNPEIVYVYTGMGPQWWKMGRELMETEPVFLEALEECDRYFKTIAGWSILEELKKPEDESKIKQTNIAQTANFIIQVGLTRLLSHFGVEPDAVVGHSVGEVTSLYVSGALTLEDALLVSYHRSRLQHTTAGTGGMLAVGLSEEELEDILRDFDEVSIAAINSDNAVTLAGEHESLDELASIFEKMKVFNRKLEVEVPYHSPMMDPIKEELLNSLESLQGQKTHIDLYSTVTGEKIDGEEINNMYWWRNVRESVRFAKAFKTLMQDNYKVFIEIGPHPVLKNSMNECAEFNQDFHFLQTLNRKQPEILNFYENLTELFTLGKDLNWNRWVGDLGQLRLPSYAWEKNHYWVESNKSIENRIGSDRNYFLRNEVESPSKVYRAEISNHFFPFLQDHIVQDKMVFPGTGYVAAAIALHKSIKKEDFFGLENIKFHQMLILNDTDVQHLYTSLNPKSNQFEIYNKEEGDDTPWFKRATGKCIIGDFNERPGSIDISALRENMPKEMHKEEVYERLNKAKLSYGPRFAGIDTVYYDENELVAKIKACPEIESEGEQHFIHPGLLDSCFQTMIVFDTENSSSFVPVSIGKLYGYESPGNEFFCHLKLKSFTSDTMIADVVICNEKGEVALKLQDVKCQEIASQNLVSDDFPDNALYQIDWVEEETRTDIDLSNHSDKLYLIVTDDYTNSLPLTSQLTAEALVVQPGTDLRELGENHYEVNLQDVSTVAKLLKDRNVTDLELVYFYDNESNENETPVSTEKYIEIINPLLNLIRYFSEAFPQSMTLNLITRGAQIVEDNDTIKNLETSAFLGLGRLMSSEFANWRIRVVDFDQKEELPISKETWKTALAQMNANKRTFEELAVRDGQVFTRIMRKVNKPEEERVMKTVTFKDTPLEMVAPEFSDLDSIYFREMNRVDPKDNELEILVENTSINFKDYLKVTNKISKDALEGTKSQDDIGLDCAGVVSRIGKNVTRFKVGDRVLAATPGTFQSYVTVDENVVGKCPKIIEENGSHAIVAYLTAIYCLEDIANLKEGEKVLIHNGSGGVGLAAINYAKMVGAEIFTTAGSEEKRDYLRNLGIKHVFNSRDLDFSRKINEITNGEGVDAVLSSLTGETFHQSLAVLAPFGKYLEIGKLNAVDNVLLPMKVFSKNLSFTSIDLDQLGKDKPKEIAKLIDKMHDYIDSGKLAPLPVKMYNPNEISDAFRLMEQGKHIGKVVVNFKDQSIQIEERNDSLFKADATYMITGGTKGLGLEIAGWMLENGAQNLILLSRSGEKDANVKSVIDGLRKKAAAIKVLAVDVADYDGMARIFVELEEHMPPLAGIFHGAMVLDDGFLLDMNDERFAKVLKPKVDGAMNLHKLSKNRNLDFFVMFSSLSSLIGHLGQANYIVANTMLDSFAFFRRCQGLPATTINLGVLGQSGVMSRDENLQKMANDFGIQSFSNEEVLMGLAEILRSKPTQVGFFKLDWNSMEKSFKTSKFSLFEELIQENVGSNSLLTPEQAENWDELLSLDSAKRQERVVDLLTDELSQILKMPKDTIPADKGVNFLGVDSILSVQLIRAINDKLAVELSPMEFTSGPNLKQLAKIITDKIMTSASDEQVFEKIN
ncbi:SDR family NAD(P)-dependent oxidoreductase [Flavobacteriaceae bacterium M23B6Z8]